MYMGTFVNAEKVIVDEKENLGYYVPRNEKGESYFELRDKPGRPKYVVIVDPNTGAVNGCAPEGWFGFHEALKVYFMDEVPENAIELKLKYRYDDDMGWRPYIDVLAWKYNEQYDARDDIIMAATTGDFEKVAKIKEWLKVVEAYEGNGYEPELPTRPY